MLPFEIEQAADETSPLIGIIRVCEIDIMFSDDLIALF